MRIDTLGIFFLSLLAVHPMYALFTHDKAAYAMQNEDVESAAAMLTSLVTDNPDNPEILYDAGVAAYLVKNFKQAEAYFRNALEQKNISDQLKELAHFNFANTCVELKELKKAVEQYEKTLLLNPNNERAQHNLAIIKKMLEQQEQQQQQDGDKDQDQQDKNEGDQQQNSEGGQGENSDQQQGEQGKKDQQNSDNNSEEQKQQEQQGDQGQSGSEEDKGQVDRQQQGNRDKEEQANKDAQRQRRDRSNDDSKDEQTDDKRDKKREHSPDSSKDSSDSVAQDTQEEQKAQGASEQDASQKENSLDKLDAWLAQVLDEREKRDAQLNKQMIRATVGEKLAGQDGQNCW